MCAPIALFAAGTWLVRVLNPPPDPNSEIELSVARDPNAQVSGGNQISFGWRAEATGGPSDKRSIIYAQSLVASSHGRSRVLYGLPPKTNTSYINVGNSSSSFNQPGSSQISQTLVFTYDDLPVWTQKLRWQGNVVSAPQNSDAPGQLGVAAVSALQQEAQIKGATRVVTQIDVPLDAQQLGAISELKLGKVNFDEAARGADTHITETMRDVERHAFERLVAFDGHTRRELWRPNHPDSFQVRIKQQGDSGSDRWEDSQLFKLHAVPASWGEIIYLVDVVANPNSKKLAGNTRHVTKTCDAKEIARLKKTGWLHFSRRLVVRKNGQTITAPVYSPTPNTQLMGVETSLSPKIWTIKVRLHYRGPNSSGLESPYGPDFSETNGQNLNLEYSATGINDAKPGEKLMTIDIPTKNLGRARPIQLRLEIADNEAAPLIIKQNLQIPQTGSSN